jgi:phenylalanyl-tRNA synthetase beta chain
VSDGNKTPYQVVCGAPNVDVDQTVIFAKIAISLAGGFKIKKVKIRGEESSGMICSEKELGMSDEHEGILVLPAIQNLGMHNSDVC